MPLPIDKTSKKTGNNNAEKTESEGSVSVTQSKLNPLAREFFPVNRVDQTVVNSFNQPIGNDGSWRRNIYTQGRGRFNRRTNRAAREEGIRRTVYVSNVYHTITEQELAAVFIPKCGYVVDCRICGDPRSHFRFGFVEFLDEPTAKKALELWGTVVGYFAIRVSPSKTAILPVNPMFLPQSEDEKDMVARTVCCTNIDKMVTRMRLLGDYANTTRIAFIEFSGAESALIALCCSGVFLGNLPIRVSPSKTPVKLNAPRSSQE